MIGRNWRKYCTPNAFDLIPDEIPFLGFLDDATVVSFAVARSRQALDDFMIWETTAL